MKKFIAILLFIITSATGYSQCIVYYFDNDHDGYGGGLAQVFCSAPNGWSSVGGDCNDGNPNIHPGATEICNQADDNCNGSIDEGLATNTYYLDNDHDGYGGTGAINVCYTPGSAYVSNNTDCNDNNINIHPGAQELCSFTDENCINGGYDGVPFYDYYYDNDNDGYGAGNPTNYCSAPGSGWRLNGGDCNDGDASIHPGAQELCTSIDEDCDGNGYNGLTFTRYFDDDDNDGFGGAFYLSLCSPTFSDKVTDSTDCNDHDHYTHPGATELCTEDDENCDGDPYDGLTFRYYFHDYDDDGYGGGAPNYDCVLRNGFVTDNTDCDDLNHNIHPGAQEQCDAIDDNCNGDIYDGLVWIRYYRDSDGDGYGNLNDFTLRCSPPEGYVTDSTDCADYNENRHPGAQEICDNIDDNCNGLLYDGLTITTYYWDNDNDGFGTPGTTLLTCGEPLPGFVSDSTDCNDDSPFVNPGAIELCTPQDENCNGDGYDGVIFTTHYNDGDGDGYGGQNSITDCGGSAPPHYVSDSSDCNDGNPLIHPGAQELCDAEDQDCDGDGYNGVIYSAYYYDNDGDGYGGENLQVACSSPGSSWTLNDGDCNDENPNIHPGAQELCDAEDQDCDGDGYNGVTYSAYYYDNDGDGYGGGNLQVACSSPGSSWTLNNGDCNDGNPSIHPGAAELCNGQDDNCNSNIDEGVTYTTYYNDVDGDGYGGPNSQIACTNPGSPWTANGGDCNDGNPSIHPGATEICNGQDENCNGVADDGIAFTIYYYDNDQDNYGGSTSQTICSSPPANWITNNGDCDDNNPLIHPGATEITGNIVDENCDGDLNEVTFSGLAESYHENDPAANLTGNPPGGFFSGPGINGSNQFIASAAGIGGPYEISYTYTDPLNYSTNITKLVNVVPDGNVVVAVKVLLQGSYDQGNHQMRGLLSGNIVDTVEVSLASATSPHDIQYSSRSAISKAGDGIFNFPPSVQGNSYYIVVRHRSSIETWSKLPIVLGATNYYDFIHP